MINLTTGERRPASCNTYACSGFCGPRKGWGMGQLAAASRPERLITLTLASGEPEVNRERVKGLVHSLRKRGYQVEVFWCVEENPRHTGFHIHLLGHGDYLPQALVQRLWGGFVDIERIRVEVDAAKYVIKTAAAPNYCTKGIAADYRKHLALNGGRVAHHSRGFMRLDTGEAQTVSAMRARSGRSATPGEWRVIPAHVAVDDQLRRRLAVAQLMHRRVSGT